MSFPSVSIGNLKMDGVRSPLIQPNNSGCTKRKTLGNDEKEKRYKDCGEATHLYYTR
jgi:hypothetical protein